MKRRKFKTEKPKQVQKCWMVELFLTLHQSIKIPEYTFALPCSLFSLLLFIVAHVGYDSKTVSRLRACCFYLLLSVAQTQFQVDSLPQNQMCESVFINHCSWISCPVLKMFVCLNKRKLQSILLVLKAPRHCVWCGWWVQCGRMKAILTQTPVFDLEVMCPFKSPARFLETVWSSICWTETLLL